MTAFRSKSGRRLASLVLGVVFAMHPAVSLASAEDATVMKEVVLPVSKAQGEASAILAVRHRPLLQALAWDVGFWVVGDEGHAGEVLSLVGRSADPKGEPGWSALHVRVDPIPDKGGDVAKTDDAEALFRLGSSVYIAGSHFGKKAGPLQAKRQFFARFDESSVVLRKGRPTLRMEIVRDDFVLHRAINDAVAEADLELIERPDSIRVAFIEAARQKNRKKSWVSRIEENDFPINVEGATASTSDTVWIGLRYPVTASGEPLLVEVEGIERLFDGGIAPTIRRVVPLAGEGSPVEPRGIRALHSIGTKLHAVTGHLDSASKKSAIRRAHPEAGAARIRHVEVETERGSAHTVTLIRSMPELSDVEGLSQMAEGGFVYVRDVEGVIHLLLGKTAEPPLAH